MLVKTQQTFVPSVTQYIADALRLTWLRRHFRFLLLSCACRFQYILSNPNNLCRNFNALFHDAQVQCYGETPTKVLRQIVKNAYINQYDNVYELGCGRGLAAFWLANFVGCRVLGTDINPIFIQRALRLKRWFSLKNITFDQEMMHRQDLRSASVIYLYGTGLHDGYINGLMKRFIRVSPGTKIVTVSYSLLQYGGEFAFSLDNEFTARFPWGKAQVYVHTKLR